MVVHSRTTSRPDSTKRSPGNDLPSFLLRDPSSTILAGMDVSVVGAGAPDRAREQAELVVLSGATPPVSVACELETAG
jgi:hypothetical protein